MGLSFEKRKAIILDYFNQFHDPKYLKLDPLIVVRRYLKHPDLEWVAMMAAVFAFGGVKQVIASVEKALFILEVKTDAPEKSLVLSGEVQTLRKRFEVFRHRIYTGDDVVALLLLYRRSIREYGSLKNQFLHHHDPKAETIEGSLTRVMEEMKSWAKDLGMVPGAHFQHMLNSPESGSACKRWLMFMKWMIRENDGIDLGVWSGSALAPAQLVIPLDTHLWKISKRLGLTRRKTPMWKTAIDVTHHLRQIDPVDPVKFDFALCRWGMLDYRKLIPKGTASTSSSSR